MRTAHEPTRHGSPKPGRKRGGLGTTCSLSGRRQMSLPLKAFPHGRPVTSARASVRALATVLVTCVALLLTLLPFASPAGAATTPKHQKQQAEHRKKLHKKKQHKKKQHPKPKPKPKKPKAPPKPPGQPPRSY